MVAFRADSPEKAIRERARKLPIHQCWINTDWEVSRMANIIVSRKHINGNITSGVFLVDLLCLGVKDCFYVFNQPENEFTDFIEDMKGHSIESHMMQAEYPLVHNVVYSGWEYAFDLGFQPDRLFEVAKFILEEDNESIEWMDIECGREGKPTLLIGPEDPGEKWLRQLRKTAGEGNYNVIYVNEEGEIILNDVHESDDSSLLEDSPNSMDEEEDIDGWDFEDLKAFLKGEKKVSPETEYRVFEKISEDLFPTQEEDKEFHEKLIQEFFSVTCAKSYEEAYFPVGNVPEDALQIVRLLSKEYLDNHDVTQAYILFNRNRNSEFFWIKMFDVVKKANLLDEFISLAQEAFSLFPNQLVFFNKYLGIIIEENSEGRREKILGDKLFLNNFDFNKKYFTTEDLAEFYNLMAINALKRNNFPHARSYINISEQLNEIFDINNDQLEYTKYKFINAILHSINDLGKKEK